MELLLVKSCILSLDGNRLSATGAFSIKQTEFGIEPFSALGGALYVPDPIMVEFELVARTRQVTRLEGDLPEVRERCAR